MGGSEAITDLRFEPITTADLDRALKAVDPHAFLVDASVLRRILRRRRRKRSTGLRLPHRKTLACDGPSLARLIDPVELGLPAGSALPPRMSLLVRPEPRAIATTAGPRLLRKYWRLLFHCHVHHALDACIAAGRLNAADVAERVRQLGRMEFAEIRAVLLHEGFLIEPHNDRAVFVEFAAVYLELKMFAAPLQAAYWPSIADCSRVDTILAGDLNADLVLQTTRLVGAADHWDPVIATAVELADAVPVADDHGSTAALSSPAFRWLIRKAERAERVGNLMRGAIVRLKAARRAGPALAGQARSVARADLDALIPRLNSALHCEATDANCLRGGLFELLTRAADGIWTQEGRTLFDLQKICIDAEREVFCLDLLSWIRTGGKQPWKRTLPHQRDVLILKHLRAATHRLASVHMSPEHRSCLSDWLHRATKQGEDRLRQRLRPLLANALAETGIRPENRPERVAVSKLTEELLDQIVEHDYVRLGDLRDALSRGNLKLPDVAGWRAYWKDDRLLNADRRLAITCDGLYRGGEVYLRALQRQSALVFGTRTGRWLTRFIAIPYGGTFVLLEALQLVVGEFTHAEVELLNPWSLAILGTFTLATLHFQGF
ncbi:MAG: hypothetical protein HYR84_05145, partial [Planctomycetes bacterium]|nr:hypothetical protein [Planctomycetota bacterium]